MGRRSGGDFKSRKGGPGFTTSSLGSRHGCFANPIRMHNKRINITKALAKRTGVDLSTPEGKEQFKYLLQECPW